MRSIRTVDFGKVDFNGTGRKINRVTVDITLNEKEDGKVTFTANVDVWNSKNSDIVCGGQAFDDVKSFFTKNVMFNEIYRLWKLYHLNDMHAGTVEQEKCIEEAIESGVMESYDYDEACKILDKNNLRVVTLEDGSEYKYGTKWLYREIPEDDLNKIKELINGEDK